MTRITHSLVPTDFSATADAALEYAFGLAERFGASVQLLHVLEDPLMVQGTSPEAFVAEGPALRTAMLDDARERMRHRTARGTKVPVDAEVLFGHGARTITEYAAERGVDLIVMGTHGRTGFAHLLLGCVAERFVRTAPCPVLTVRHPTVKEQRPEPVYDTQHLPA
jgi:nucleotide-binding universal stress UspA family protein